MTGLPASDSAPTAATGDEGDVARGVGQHGAHLAVDRPCLEQRRPGLQEDEIGVLLDWRAARCRGPASVT